MKAALWVAGCLAFGMLLFVAWRHGDDWLKTGQPAALGSGPPLARLQFEDRRVVEVLAHGTGVFEDGEYREQQRKSTAFHLRAPSTPVRVQSTFGQATHVRAEFAPGELYLCLRTDPRIDPAGWTYRRGAFVHDRLGRKSVPSRSPIELPASSAEVAPVIVQVADGNSGWITANGPLSPFGVELPYFWMVFENWPRSPGTLTFRVAVPGQAPQTFSAPNPGHVAAPVVTAAPGIREISTPDYKVSISPSYEGLPGYGRVLDAHPDAYLTRRYDREVPFEVVHMKLTGTFGNPIPELAIEGLTSGFGRSRSGFPLAGDDARLEAEVLVRAKPEYPRDLSEVTIVAEGERDADGTVRITRAFPATGVDRAFGGGEPSSLRSGAINFGLELHSSGEGPVDFTEGTSWWLHLFVDDLSRSSGRFTPPPRGSMPQVRSSFTGELAPGQRFRVGVAPPPEARRHRFHLDAP